jgi:anti-sigma regulatory factor (Ser/Thr protein kinase)
MKPDAMGKPLEAPHLPDAVRVEQTHLRLPSQPSWIEPAVEYLKNRALLCSACQESRAGKLLVALHEALNNAIVHGNLEISSELKERDDDAYARALATRAADPHFARRTVDVFVNYDGQRCQWAITDQGPGFNVAKVMRRLDEDDSELLLASGRGILMMRSFMDELRFEAGGRRVVLAMHKASGQENRRQERLPVQARLRVAPLRADGSVDWDAAYAAVARNLSSEGIGLLQTHLAEAGRVLVGIEVGEELVYVPAEIRHCRSLGPDVVELGCRFQTPAVPAGTAADVAEAVGKILEQARGVPGQDERREHPRLPYSDTIEIHAGSDPTVILGYPRNLSRGGLAFITTRPLPQTFTVTFPPRGREPALHLLAELVRSAKVEEGFYEVAARFTDFATSPSAQAEDRAP